MKLRQIISKISIKIEGIYLIKGFTRRTFINANQSYAKRNQYLMIKWSSALFCLPKHINLILLGNTSVTDTMSLIEFEGVICKGILNKHENLRKSLENSKKEIQTLTSPSPDPASGKADCPRQSRNLLSCSRYWSLQIITFQVRQYIDPGVNILIRKSSHQN